MGSDQFLCSTRKHRFFVPTAARRRRRAQTPSRLAGARPRPHHHHRQASLDGGEHGVILPRSERI